jgi:hypothetical protein
MENMEKNTKNKKRPTKDEIAKGKIANALTSAAKNHIVATTDDIYDTNLLEYQDEINQSIFETLSGVAKEDTLVTGISNIREDISKIELDTSDLAKEDTLAEGVAYIVNKIETTQPDLSTIAKEETLTTGVSNIINDVDSQANAVTSTINSKTENIIDTVNSQANAVIETVNSQAGNVINSINTNTTSVVEYHAQGIQDNINAKTTDILNTINTQTQSLANDIVNLDDNLDSGVTRIFDAINLIKEELQGENSAITLTYLYDTLGDLSTLLDEINGEEMPVEFATDYARQGENSGATNTAILDAIQELTSVVCSSDNNKEEIVDAINYVGGTAVSNMSWSELAQVIKNLNVV